MKKDLTQLVINAQSNNTEALNQLFCETYNDVYYFALKTVKDENIAYDITQETFIEVIRTINTLKEPGAFRIWLRMVTYHQCTRYFKKKKDVLVDEDEEGATLFDSLEEDNAEFIPDKALDLCEFRQIIMGIVDQLSEEQRAAVLMYYFDGLTVNHIAMIQNVSEGTVKSRLNYARKYIKAAVEKYEKDHNIKLHGGMLPILFWMFSYDFHLTPIPSAPSFGHLHGAATKGYQADVSAKAAVKKASKATAKKAGMALSTKIIAGVAAVVLAGCAAVGIAVAMNKKGNDAPAAESVMTDEVLEEQNVGTVFEFGAYEQDNNTSNGAEPIEWTVLAEEEDKVLVISKYALDSCVFNNKVMNIGWENCYLRVWMNSDFYDAAFSEDQKAGIVDTIRAEGATADKIFVLNIDEANKYFNSTDDRACNATSYAQSSGAWINKTTGYCYWWLTDDAPKDGNMANVNSLGEVDSVGCSVDSGNAAVRPAMWIMKEYAGIKTEEEVKDTAENTEEIEDDTVNNPEEPLNVITVLSNETVAGRWEKHLTFKEFAEVSGGSKTAFGEVISYGTFTKKMIIFVEFKNDNTAVGGIDSESFKEVMPELIDAMVEYYCSPEILAKNEGFDPAGYDAWFASIGTTPEQYKENLRQEFTAKLDTPEGQQMLTGSDEISEYTYEIEGDTVKLYEGSQKRDVLELKDGKLWVTADNDKVGFTKQ